MHLYSQIGTGSMKFVSGTHYEGNWEDGCIQVTNSGGFRSAVAAPHTVHLSPVGTRCTLQVYVLQR